MKFLIVAALVASVAAYGGSSGGYGGSSRSSGGYGGMGGGSRGGFGGSSGGAGGQVVNAAIQSRHQIQFRDVPSSGSVAPTTVEVGAGQVPLNILFRSASSNLNIQQAHDGASGSNQESSSEDEPHVLRHSVTKPIIQEIREIITPSRKIVQEIQPVQEEILTIVAKESGNGGRGGAGAGAGFGGASFGGLGGGRGAGAGGYGKSSGSKGGY